jgi:hypothetical protein
MDRTRVLEIIAAYGADATRWPAAEREAAQSLVAEDAALRAEFDAAASLDSELTAWAMAPVAVGDIAATAAADGALARVASRRRWWPAAAVGGSIAASLLAAVLILPTPSSDPSPEPATQVAQVAPTANTIQTAQVEQDVQVWASVFTLTPEEESLI